ncbi:hypothetical protein NPIL_562971 [Nephila pilipes]|uniref:Uncharacterized protein n=1 Tax=Nephila pilipes TaxID=299642 RepID=A0A8X6QS85_NEPPI|nr:hypothetical protein NPIL_562971 [Nephila pilipes]
MFSTLKVVILIFLYLTQNICYCSHSCGEDNHGRNQNFWDTVKETVSEASKNDILTFGLKTAALAGTAIVGAPVLVSAAGFGAGGIAAGSLAATVQGLWFGGSLAGMSGAAFAGLQSIGAAGLGVVAKTAIVTASGAAVKAFDVLKGDSKPESKDEGEPKAQGYTEGNTESYTETTIRRCEEIRTKTYSESKSCN